MSARPSRLARAVVALGAATAVIAGALVAAPASATGATMSCLPANGLSTGDETKALRLMAGYLTIPGYREVYIGTSGNVDWTLDPFKSDSWRKHFASLKWVELLTMWYQRRPARTDYLDRAELIAADFARDHPVGAGPYRAAAWNGQYAGQRATVYSCLDYLEPGLPWVHAALAGHGRWLADPANDPGAWNQGVDAFLGLLVAGCATGTWPWVDRARLRFSQLLPQTIDAQGATLEQAPGYGVYLYYRWGLVADKLAECGEPVPIALQDRRDKLAEFLSWATDPSGNLVQLGDTFRAPLRPLAGTPMAYVASAGAEGIAPGATSRVYGAGYVFGRSTWNPYAASSYYSLRFGPARNYHGHDDHQSVTYYAYGHPVLVDSGHFGYTAGAYRTYLISPSAHNVLTLPGVPFKKHLPTRMVRKGGTPAWQWFELSDTAYNHQTRARSVLVDPTANVLLTFDRATRATSGSFQQLWHLPPGTRVKVAGRGVAVGTSADGKLTTTIVQLPLRRQVLPPGSTTVVTGRLQPYQGWVSYVDRGRSAAPTVVMSRGGTRVAMVTAVIAAPAGVPVSASINTNPDGWYRVVVRTGDQTRILKVSPGGALSG